MYYGSLFRELNIDSFDFWGTSIKSESIISYITAIGFLIVCILSPILSGIADYLGTKKFFMKLFCGVGSISCMLLYFFSLDYMLLSLLIYMFGLIGFWGSLVFYNSYLPDIAFTEQQDRISAKGYALGYIGSVILLLLNLLLVMKYDIFGFTTAMTAMRFSFILVGLWWIGFSLYTFRYLPDFKNEKKITKSLFFKGFRELKRVWGELKEYVALKRYLVAFFVYSMAVQTVMIIAAYFGEKEIAWENDTQRTTGLILSILMIQFSSCTRSLFDFSIVKKNWQYLYVMCIKCVMDYNMSICIYYNHT